MSRRVSDARRQHVNAPLCEVFGHPSILVQEVVGPLVLPGSLNSTSALSRPRSHQTNILGIDSVCIADWGNAPARRVRTMRATTLGLARLMPNDLRQSFLPWPRRPPFGPSKPRPACLVRRRAVVSNMPMSLPPDFCRDIEEVLAYLALGDLSGLASLHRVQDLQSFLMHREAVGLLRANPTLVAQAEVRLSRWMSNSEPYSRPLLERWTEILAARDWDAALANSDDAQQLRQASPLAGLLPDDTRLAIIRYVRELTNQA